jgi:hypothetical protein
MVLSELIPPLIEAVLVDTPKIVPSFWIERGYTL